jgi:acetoin utilization protein AcuB
MLMPPISRFMTRQPWTIRPHASLASAKAMMIEHGIRHLPVIDGDKLVGIVSERDVLRLERLEHLGNHFTVEDAMTDDVYTAETDQPVDQVVEAMAENKYGSAVVKNRRYAVEGIFTTVDGMQVLADVLRREAG